MEAFYVHKKGWNVMRAKDSNNAKKIADNMVTACNNPSLGYDQGASRLGVIAAGIKTILPTGCDCSSLVRACVKEATGKDPGNFNTSNEVNALAKTGLFKPVFEYTSATKLERGDILVTKTKGHTAVVVEVKTEAAKPPKVPTTKIQNGVEFLWKYFSSCGLSDYAVAGILGNLHEESAMKPNNLQNTSEKKFKVNDDEYTQLVDNGIYTKDQFVNDKAGYGLAQWTSAGRKKGLYEYLKGSGKSIADLDGQAHYIWKEISADKSLMSALKSAKSVREASDAVLHKYERPADQSESAEKKRAVAGNSYYSIYAKTKTAPAPITPVVSNGEPFLVKVDNQFLNIRKGPGLEYDKTGQYTGIGTFTIMEVKNGFGRLKSGQGWISMDYATRI